MCNYPRLFYTNVNDPTDQIISSTQGNHFCRGKHIICMIPVEYQNLRVIVCNNIDFSRFIDQDIKHLRNTCIRSGWNYRILSST